MSLVYTSREVATGSATPPGTCAGVPVYLRVAGEEWRGPRKEELGTAAVGRNGCGIVGGMTGCMVMAKEEEEEEDKDAESSESSIGDGGESSLSLSSSTADDREDGEEEVQSNLNKDTLGCLDSLEESLPTKKGLSKCFSGKSRSFASLSDAVVLGSAKDLAKVENPFNKRRRILMACKASWNRRASYAALDTPNLWALEEDQEYDDVGKDGRGKRCVDVPKPPRPQQPAPLSMARKHIKALKSPRSFSLTDLQHA